MRASEGDDPIGAFAAALNARLAADAHIKRAVAFGWFCAGCAIAVCLFALGGALAIWGYSHTISVEPSAKIVAKAFEDSFRRLQLRSSVTGVMVLSNPEISLAKDQVVRLAEGSTLKVDPASSIRVAGEFRTDVPQPSKRQLQLDATTSAKELPFTRYTVFKSAPFGAGVVVTGWNFDLSDTTRPQLQRCYYEQTLDKGISATQTIAVDGTPRKSGALTKLTFDFEGALGNCIWFSGL